ncbi:MAG TPA: EAL domain-containing protein [Xanthomonadaceae bacterium]|nr:EAL domain-containing protein [Xanthomonadaceae bacterium]
MTVRFHVSLTAIALWLLGLSLAGASPRVDATVRDFYFKRLGTEQGLVQNTITALEEDAQGFVWVGTQGGLHRYDGERFRAYRHDPNDPSSLPDSFVTALEVEPRVALWIGTYSQYVVRLDLRTGEFRRYPPAAGGASRHVRSLLVADGQVWVGTGAGLERLDPRTGKRVRVVRLEGGGAPGQALVRDGDGIVWFGSSAGLYRIDGNGGSLRIGPALPVTALLVDADDRLWVGRSDGLYRLGTDGRTLQRAWPARGEPGFGVRALVQAPDGRLWLSLAGEGLLRFDPRDSTTQRIRENAAVPGSLPESSIGTLLVDRSGQLWIGGQIRGVAVTDPHGARFSYLVDTAPVSPVAASSVRAVVEGDDGALWVGTDAGLLLRHPLGGGGFQDLGVLLPPTWHDAEGALSAARIMGFERASPHRLWVATTRGLLLLDTAARRVSTFAPVNRAMPGLRSIDRDRDGILWLGSNGEGLFRFRPDTGLLVQVAAGGDAGDGLIHAVEVDRHGRVWFATSDGLGLHEPATRRTRRFRHGIDDPASLAGDLVRALHEAADGTLWIGSHSGLSRVRESSGGIAFDHPLALALEDRAMPTVYSIAESPTGTLWLGTDNGILRFEPGTGDGRGRVRHYGLSDGLQDVEFNGGATTVLEDGRVAMGGVNGLNLFDPARIGEKDYDAPLRLLGVRIGADAPRDGTVLWQPEQLVVPGEAGIVRLRVGALDYAATSPIRYRYRMHGLHEDWIDNGSRNDITYTGLPAGNYELQVQATGRDGAWNPDGLALPVVVQPPAWRQPLFLAAYVLGVLLLAGIAVGAWLQRRARERGYFRQIREREERLKLALWASGEQFWDYDLVRGALHWMRGDDTAGPIPDIGTLTSSADEHQIHPDDLPQVKERMREHLRGHQGLFLSEHRVKRPDGGWTWIRTRGRVVERDEEGRALRVAGTARDISISRRAERERRIATEVLRSMTEAVTVFDRDFRFVSVNPAFARMTGYQQSEVVGRPTDLLDSGRHDPGFYATWRSELKRHGRWSGEMWQRRKDGEEFLCWLQSSAVLDASGQPVHYVAVLTDITDQKRAEQELRYLANYDTLTGLPNRALLSERLSRAIVRARRQQARIAVLFLDLDRFKDINDSLGHAAGDRILRAAAVRLQEIVGREHTVARLGGDEFTVVLEGIGSPEAAERVARDLIAAFEVPLEIDTDLDVTISPSIGISLYPDNALAPSDLLKHADTAMYQAKAAGRRTCMRYAESMDVHIRRRATMAGALRKVLDRNELSLVFQPRLSLPQARITGVEALLRWDSAELGSIPPAQFIPLAEESGLILEIGEWALREACTTLQRWRAQGLDPLAMSVNVSSLQLLRGDLPAVVTRILAETGLPADALELELTESVIMAGGEHTMAALQAFRRTGVSLAIDDFGTGYSSLAYLKRLPITTLKIDKEFIDDLTRDPDDEAITSTVITMAHSLGLVVVAEGVETPAQVQFLREHGCDEIQGFWLAPAMLPDECLAFVRAWMPPTPDAGAP